MPHRSRCSSQSFEKQPGEIPWEASFCSGRNSSPLTFVWDQLNHVIWPYFPLQPYTFSLHTSEWIIRDKQASTLPFFSPALVFMVGASFPMLHGLWQSHVGREGQWAEPTRPSVLAAADSRAIAPLLTYLKAMIDKLLLTAKKKTFIKPQPWWQVGSTIT